MKEGWDFRDGEQENEKNARETPMVAGKVLTLDDLALEIRIIGHELEQVRDEKMAIDRVQAKMRTELSQLNDRHKAAVEAFETATRLVVGPE